MPEQFQKFIRVLAALEQYEVEYILIGGVALILHGSERLTRDIDIVLKPESKNIEKLRKALYSVFDDNSIEEISTKELDKYSVIRYGTPDGFYIDIIDRIGQLASYYDIKYETIVYEDVKIRIATPDSLLKLKKDSLRQRDQMDALFLSELINNLKN